VFFSWRLTINTKNRINKVKKIIPKLKKSKDNNKPIVIPIKPLNTKVQKQLKNMNNKTKNPNLLKKNKNNK